MSAATIVRVARSSALGLVLLSAMIIGLTPAAPVRAQSELPPIPDPVPVTLDPKTTALLSLDFGPSGCGIRPTCIESLPMVAAIQARSREAGVTLIHAVLPAGFLPEVAPLPDEPVVRAPLADKFFQTDLDQILKDRGIETTIIMGTSANGAALYTSFGAAARGFTVVVAEDAISSSTDFATFLTRWTLLNGPTTANPENNPLEKGRVTLSRTDLISFQQ